MSQRAKIADVAKAAGVSTTTVSRIINGHYDKMTPETRKRVEAVIKELNFVPLASAQRLRVNKSNTIGVLVGDISNPFSSLLAKGIDVVLKEAGYDIILMNTNNDLETEKRALTSLYHQQVDGIIIQPNAGHFTQFETIANSEVPIQMVDREVWDLPSEIGAVTSANKDACYRLGKILVDRGYDNIIAVSAHYAEASGQIPRLAGLEAAANDYGLSYHDIETRGHDFEWLSTTFTQQLARLTGRTAVISLMGPVLFDILKITKEHHLSFPDDFGLISFDDWEWSRYVGDGIFLLKQDMELMGNYAARKVLAQIDNKKSGAGTTLLPVQIIDRPSI
ncbi:MAG: LacI family DNA-binding transcriptional regulator [Limosilactobacillus sp.]|uniref:LacI family DNA-binding transcriptional regulator n=1 Tax=Limosilactobacillus sp. TaxID=2773925 RepID=UPI002704685F|nr:LacI family DNA-binding transcriptional regulator [Limosilactobacillus sp.]